MLRIVLPTAAATASIHAVAAADVRVAVEVVVDVYVDVIVAAPPAVITPTTMPSRSHRHTDTEGNGHSGHVSTRWRRWWIDNRRIGINGWAVDHGRVISRHINDLWIGLLNDNDLLGLDNFCFHLLLLSGFQIARVLGLFPHALNGIHHVTLLCQESIAQVGDPLNVIRKALHYVRKGSQALHAWVPGLF